eukprot:Nk52_evm21s233 gene=Nk52_evmTU21s233
MGTSSVLLLSQLGSRLPSVTRISSSVAGRGVLLAGSLRLCGYCSSSGEAMRDQGDGTVVAPRRMSSYVKDGGNRTRIMFTVQEKVGALQEVLNLFSQNGINMSHIESRPADKSRRVQRGGGDYDFYVNLECDTTRMKKLAPELERVTNTDVVVIDSEGAMEGMHWFPRKFVDMERLSNRVKEAGCDLQSDHPGFQDPVYRERRAQINDIAFNYRHGTPIPRVEYTAQETECWGKIFNHLTSLYPTHACEEHNRIFELLKDNCGYRADNVPQLQDVSDFLKDCTGFRLRPVAGLLSSRDFLNGLAFRVFHSTQYLRHHSVPLYTPEPDIVHELLGHAPLFADPAFADFSSEIGMASLGASDEEIERLATVYWFTVEFGVCRQKDGLKAYGAGLLSSFGELEYALSDKPDVRAFDCEKMSVTKYPITEYQPIYWAAESFEKAQRCVREFAQENIQKPFDLRYNPYTESIEVLNDMHSLQKLASSIRNDQIVLTNAMSRYNKFNDGEQ